MAYEVSFTDVQFPDGLRSYSATLATFDANALIKHLASRGLTLNCFGNVRHPDTVIAEEWEDDRLNGRILRAGSELIGTFVVRHLADATIPDAGQDAIPVDAIPVEAVLAEHGDRDPFGWPIPY